MNVKHESPADTALTIDNNGMVPLLLRVYHAEKCNNPSTGA